VLAGLQPHCVPGILLWRCRRSHRLSGVMAPTAFRGRAGNPVAAGVPPLALNRPSAWVVVLVAVLRWRATEPLGHGTSSSIWLDCSHGLAVRQGGCPVPWPLMPAHGSAGWLPIGSVGARNTVGWISDKDLRS